MLVGSNPKIELLSPSIEFGAQAIAVDAGPGPVTIQFKIQCIMRHSLEGNLVYNADDVWFGAGAFRQYAEDLDVFLGGRSNDAELATVGREFVLRIERPHVPARISVTVTEWQGEGEPDTVAAAGCLIWNLDIIHGWVRDLRAYGGSIAEWIIANEARGTS